MKRPIPTTVPSQRPVVPASLAAVRGGTDVRYASTTSTTRSGDDDDPNGSIIIIGRDGP